MSVTKLEKPEQFDSIVKENSNRLLVVFFSASWSDECKLMSNVVDELSKQLIGEKKSDQVGFVHVEAEENEELCIKSGIESVPSFLFIKNGQVLSKLSGAEPGELRKRISQYTQTITSVAENKEVSLNDRLKKLINQAPVVLFMKGSPQEPRCGFSRQIIEILNNQNVKFSHFDILSDNDVREGLKKYSNWPTYPQLYAKGELIGGLDIVKEMIQNGEFQSVIPKPEESLNERLKKLINRSKCMLFMKGNAKEPRCGFSRQIIEIMNETGVKYDTFDILSDEEVRQGLKEYSKWPTYPQVYVDGELVGGLDILKELKQSGELVETLKGKQ